MGSFDGQSDAVYMWRDGGQFDDDLKRLRLINCLFYGTSGQDIQIRNLPDAFGLVTHCAFEEGEFATSGVEPVATVFLTGNPCVSLSDITLASGSPCASTQALVVGLDEDLGGTLVPQGDGPDIGAYEYPVISAAPTEVDLPLASLNSAKVWPNPFNPQTRISFHLETDTQVELAIYDIRGALVQRLFSGHLDGRHPGVPLEWTGQERTIRGLGDLPGGDSGRGATIAGQDDS